jgi:hypothetical protein
MLNKIKTIIILVLVAVTAVIGISTVAIESNGTIAEAEEQLAILDSTNKKDINHELVIDNLSFMLNGVTRDKAMELGLKDKEVVILSKDSDTTYSDIAVISFNDNNMLIYNTESMLNNSINSIKDSIVTMTILLVIMLVFAIVIVSDHIEDVRIAKARS